MSFHLFDERIGAVTEFIPLNPGKVSIYHCGLTVQSAPHLGHIRKEVVFDVLDPEQQKALADIAGQLVDRLRGEQHPATPTADVA